VEPDLEPELVEVSMSMSKLSLQDLAGILRTFKMSESVHEAAGLHEYRHVDPTARGPRSKVEVLIYVVNLMPLAPYSTSCCSLSNS